MIFRLIFVFFYIFFPESRNKHAVYGLRSLLKTKETVKKPTKAHTTKNPAPNTLTDPPKLFHCEYCPDIEFDSKRKIRNHIRHHVKRGFSICTIPGCGQMYTNFIKHIKNYHKQKQPFKCTECDATFATLDDVTWHERSHTGKQSFECELCSEKFECQISRRNHEILKHTLEGVTLFCEYCKRPFLTKQRLETHRLTTHLIQSGPHKCKECGRPFGTIAALRHHMKIHGKRDRKCKYCPQLFKTNAVRSHHERMQHEWKNTIQIYYNAAMKK